jgi:hypothetical protein
MHAKTCLQVEVTFADCFKSLPGQQRHLMTLQCEEAYMLDYQKPASAINDAKASQIYELGNNELHA